MTPTTDIAEQLRALAARLEQLEARPACTCTRCEAAIAEARREARVTRYAEILAMASQPRAELLARMDVGDRRGFFAWCSIPDAVRVLVAMDADTRAALLPDVPPSVYDMLDVELAAEAGKLPQWHRVSSKYMWGGGRIEIDPITAKDFKRVLGAAIRNDLGRWYLARPRWSPLPAQSDHVILRLAEIHARARLDPEFAEALADGTLTSTPLTEQECKAHLLGSYRMIPRHAREELVSDAELSDVR